MIRLEYEQAKKIGEEVLTKLQPFIDRAEIAGSIRRKKTEVHDIDLVIQPKEEFMILERIKGILRTYGKLELDGQQIIRVMGENGTEIDCYIANQKNYEVILLIRTGSKEHNVKLAQEAIKQGKSLRFSEGLIDKATGRLLADTERSIYEKLNMEYVEPVNRS